MSGFKHYKRKVLFYEMRPYVLGETLDGVSISDVDKQLPTLEGGYIARNPANHDDKWYVSKEYFEANLEEAYQAAENALENKKLFGLTFGQAIEALKKGELLSRSGWNGKGMFIFQRPEDEINIRVVVEQVKSLPQKVKDYFDKQDDRENAGEFGLAKIKFTSYFCMKAADGTIVNGWLASQTDMAAEDWCIVE